MEALVERGVSWEVENRLAAEIRGAVRRRLTHESQLVGAARCLAPYSPTVKEALLESVSLLAGHGAYGRALYRAGIRVLAELGEPRVSGLIAEALEGEDAGGEATLSAACFDSSDELSMPLAHVVMRRSPHRAFAAEVARLARGESDGAPLASIAPRINESHRIELCVSLFVPLLWRRRALPSGVSPALAVLRDAERHLGRWLVLAEVATRAGDLQPMTIAANRRSDDASSTRAAWVLIHWALAEVRGGSSPPAVRPTLELVSRLSDRPSAERDTTFLFRMAAARVLTTKPMLESLAKTSSRAPEVALRAQLYLLRDHGREDFRNRLVNAARPTAAGSLHGLAAAALFDAGERCLALELCTALSASRHVPDIAWAGLVCASARAGSVADVVSEATFRRVQLGWLE